MAKGSSGCAAGAGGDREEKVIYSFVKLARIICIDHGLPRALSNNK